MPTSPPAKLASPPPYFDILSPPRRPHSRPLFRVPTSAFRVQVVARRPLFPIANARARTPRTDNRTSRTHAAASNAAVRGHGETARRGTKWRRPGRPKSRHELSGSLSSSIGFYRQKKSADDPKPRSPGGSVYDDCDDQESLPSNAKHPPPIGVRQSIRSAPSGAAN